VLIAGIPALVLLVFYYREVAVTYYMTKNPLQPSSQSMARTVEGVMIGSMRGLQATAREIDWRASPPSQEWIREKIGKSVREGQLGSFSGWTVIDRDGHVLAAVDRRDINPYLDEAKSLVHELLLSGGHVRERIIVVPGRIPLILFLVAVRTGSVDSPGGGVLVGLQNFSAGINRYMMVPRIRSSPGLSYVLSSDGQILAASDRSIVGKNVKDLGRSSVLDRFRAGKSGPFVRTVDGVPTLFGSTMLVDMTGLLPQNLFAVLEAPKKAIDAEAMRIRLNMDLIVFLLVPAFMGIVLFLIYRSLRS
jgi:hypothetical protein